MSAAAAAAAIAHAASRGDPIGLLDVEVCEGCGTARAANRERLAGINLCVDVRRYTSTAENVVAARDAHAARSKHGLLKAGRACAGPRQPCALLRLGIRLDKRLEQKPRRVGSAEAAVAKERRKARAGAALTRLAAALVEEKAALRSGQRLNSDARRQVKAR